MNDDEFLLDEDEDLDGEYITPIEEDEEDSDEDNIEDEEDSNKSKDLKKSTEDEMLGNLTRDEIYLSTAYDDIANSIKKNDEKVSLDGNVFDSCIIDAVRTILNSAPVNSSTLTVENLVKQCFDSQGHNRIPSSKYTPDQPMRGGNLSEELGGSGDDNDFNIEFAKEARNHIERFVDYLVHRDLSKDTIISKRRKQRHLPAFLIYLFSSGVYDLLLHCSTLPPEYAKQVDNAFKQILNQKHKIVEDLAKQYESRGRDKVAERVRKMGLSWFDREPAVIKSLKMFKDLELTQEDIVDYRSYRQKFNNASKSITQELISDYIEVVLVPGKINEKLKDKTRFDAISEVKEIYKKWSEENPIDSELAKSIILNK